MKEVKTQNLITSEIGTQEGINVHLWTIVGFQQGDRQAQCVIETENYPDSGM